MINYYFVRNSMRAEDLEEKDNFPTFRSVDELVAQGCSNACISIQVDHNLDVGAKAAFVEGIRQQLNTAGYHIWRENLQFDPYEAIVRSDF